MPGNVATQKLFDVNEKYGESLKRLRLAHGEDWETRISERPVLRKCLLVGAAVLLTGAAAWGAWKAARAKKGES